MVERSEQIWKKNSESWVSVTIDKPHEKSIATVILCHGLTGDKIGPQKLLTNLAAYLAKNISVEVVRFDFCGSGLSSGSFTSTSFESMTNDAYFVANKMTNPVIWMGISTGGLIALMAASQRRKNEPVVVISNGIAENIQFMGVDNALISLREGQLFLNKEYFTGRSTLFPRKSFLDNCDNVSVVLGGRDEKHFKERDSLMELGVDTYVVDNADHLFTEPLARSQMYKLVGDIIHEYTRHHFLPNCKG